VFNIFFFLLGSVSILGQIVILREITSLFYGNELFYGLGLGAWLLFTGLGSLLAPKVVRPIRHGRERLVNIVFIFILLFFLFIFLPFLIIFLRFFVGKNIPVGQLPNFWFSLLILGLSIFIFCFPLGGLFPLAVFNWQKKKRGEVVNKAYFWETVGLAFAGLLFSFILAITSFPLFSKINETSLKWRYPGLIKAFNSKYNQIVVSKKNKQLNFFFNGQLAFSSGESFANQQLLNLIKPFILKKKNILLLGNPTLTSEIEKIFSPQKLDFLEMDEELLHLEKPLLDKKTKPIIADPRTFLNQTQKTWDLILFSPGNPQTLLTNRYFTSESFFQVKNHLTKDGIFVLLFYLPTDYQSQEAIRFGASIYQTLKTVFPKIELLTPEDQIVLIAGKNIVKFNEAKIDQKWRKYFWHQIESGKREEIVKKLTDVKENLNTDLEPVAFFYQQLFWQTMFSFKLPQIILKIASFVPFIFLILFLLFFFKGKKYWRLGFLMACSSFILMSLETLIIVMFQTKIGYLYSQISLIFTSVLLGMAVGVKLKVKSQKLKVIFLSYLPILGMFLLKTNLMENSIFWFLIAFFSGVVGGAIFAVVNNLYIRTEKNPGYIYSFDLFGGALGAFLTASFLLPVFGVNKLICGLMFLVLMGFWFKT
jgi:spermidine synthase